MAVAIRYRARRMRLLALSEEPIEDMGGMATVATCLAENQRIIKSIWPMWINTTARRMIESSGLTFKSTFVRHLGITDAIIRYADRHETHHTARQWLSTRWTSSALSERSIS